MSIFCCVFNLTNKFEYDIIQIFKTKRLEYGIIYIKRRYNMAWTINETRVTLEDKSYTSYGVSGNGCVIEDISPNHSEIADFVDELNKYEASPAHIYELVENFLAR